MFDMIRVNRIFCYRDCILNVKCIPPVAVDGRGKRGVQHC